MASTGTGMFPNVLTRTRYLASSNGLRARAGFQASLIARIAAHSLRAGLVTQCSLNGISPFTVAEITGHKTLSVVKQYCRVADAIGAASKIASSL